MREHEGSISQSGLKASDDFPVPVSIPCADLLTMTRPQMAVLLRMSDDLGYPFRDIASDCRVSVPETRAIIHQFHRQGLTGFGPLYDEAVICGSGYWLRKPGWELQDQVCRLLTWKERDELTDPEWAAFHAAIGIETGTAETERLGPKAESPAIAQTPPGVSND